MSSPHFAQTTRTSVRSPHGLCNSSTGGAGNSVLEILKAPRTVERLAKHYPDPALPDNARGARDGAVLIQQFDVSHARRPSGRASDALIGL
jgi:hypothetical protein